MKPGETTDEQSIKRLRPLLPRERRAGVPDGYFDQLPEKVLHRIQPKVPSRSFQFWPLAVAVCLLSIAFWLRSTSAPSLNPSIDRPLLTQDELYLELSQQDLQEDELLEVLGNEAGAPDDLPPPLEISQDSLLLYLDNITPLH